MAQLTLESPRLRVVLGNPDDAQTWTEHTVQVIGRDTTAAETLFGVQKLGRTIDHPVRFLVAMAFYALTRTGAYSGPFDRFEAEYIEVQPVGTETVGPTGPGHEPG